MPSGTTHMVIGALASSYLAYRLNCDIAWAGVGMLGAVLPDIDHPRSFLGRFNPFAKCFIHRGLTHSLLACTCFGALAYGLAGAQVAKFLVLGYLSHLLLDAYTPKGIPFWWPLRR